MFLQMLALATIVHPQFVRNAPPNVTTRSKGGAFTVLYTFQGPPDGEFPNSGVVMDGKGNLYGNTQAGGANDSGSIFKADQANAIYAALGFRHELIERGKPWQDYIETTFGIQRRISARSAAPEDEPGDKQQPAPHR